MLLEKGRLISLLFLILSYISLGIMMFRVFANSALVILDEAYSPVTTYNGLGYLIVSISLLFVIGLLVMITILWIKNLFLDKVMFIYLISFLLFRFIMVLSLTIIYNSIDVESNNYISSLLLTIWKTTSGTNLMHTYFEMIKVVPYLLSILVIELIPILSYFIGIRLMKWKKIAPIVSASSAVFVIIGTMILVNILVDEPFTVFTGWNSIGVLTVSLALMSYAINRVVNWRFIY